MNVTSHNGDFQARVAQLAQEWRTNPRWKGITRPYRPEDVIRLRGSYDWSYSLAEHGAQRL
jgi:isocitrate lyase